MRKTNPIKCLFLDVGGVLLTDGWNHAARERAAQIFKLDLKEMEERHHLTFDTYEVGKLTLDEYLDRTVFYQRRSFSHAAFRKFMFAQSRPLPGMIDLVRKLKERHHLKIAVVSNEGLELTRHRIKAFKLGEFVDFFISSCFVHFRKPDMEIYRLALDVAQVESHQVAYIEDRLMFVQVANSLGIRGIQHLDYETTRARLAGFGLIAR